MKYKVGDKVRVKSKEWFDKQPKDEDEDIISPIDGENVCFTSSMSKLCGKEITIKEVHEGFYFSSETIWSFRDWMLEDLTAEPVKKHTIQRRKFSKIGNLIY